MIVPHVNEYVWRLANGHKVCTLSKHLDGGYTITGGYFGYPDFGTEAKVLERVERKLYHYKSVTRAIEPIYGEFVIDRHTGEKIPI